MGFRGEGLDPRGRGPTRVCVCEREREREREGERARERARERERGRERGTAVYSGYEPVHHFPVEQPQHLSCGFRPRVSRLYVLTALTAYSTDTNTFTVST